MKTTILTMTLAAWTLAASAGAQVLTTGGTAGGNINAGANIGDGNHTGASINSQNPEAAEIRAKSNVVQAQDIARENTNMDTQNKNVVTTPAELGATGSRAGKTMTARQVAGAAHANDIMPREAADYTYYQSANVYFSPGTKTYYYANNGQWYSSATLPAGVNLGTGTTVNVRGLGKIKE